MRGSSFGKAIRPERPDGPIRFPDKIRKPPDDGHVIPERWKPPKDPEIPPPPPPAKEPPKNPPKDKKG